MDPLMLNKTILALIIIFSLLTKSNLAIKSPPKILKLENISQILRHGARTPNRVYGNEYPEWIKQSGLSMITPVGERQLYLMSRQMLKKYPLFIPSL